MARIRTFIAVEVDKNIRERMVTLQETLARSGTDVNWTQPENMHVTLLFLGEVDERDVVSVCRAVSACCEKLAPFTMKVERAGCFPNPRRPRILWVGVGDGTQELCALHDALETPLLELGCYRREERQYTPHITLGRVKGQRPADRLAEELQRQLGWRAGEAEVREVVVMSSELRPEGPVYAVLSRGKLRRAGAGA